MARTTTQHRCTSCGHTQGKWLGRCPQCNSWGTLEEVTSAAKLSVGLKSSATAAHTTRKAQRVADISTTDAPRRPTGISEFDRVLGGGYVPGGVVLLAGEPGVGKSTLLLSVADLAAKNGQRALIVSGEESATQIKLRAERIGADAHDLFIAAETDLSVILAHIEDVNPDLLIADSLQTIASPEIEGRVGQVSQTIEVATTLTRVAKDRGMPLMLIGQVTKDGNIAGPRVVEHLVDVVLHFEGDQRSALRMIRGVKNRYGAADEVACFQMTAGGIQEVPDPAGLFREGGDPAPGSCLTVNLEGRRTFLAEVQALVNQSVAEKPRRGVSGLDPARMNLLMAVLEAHGGVRLGSNDVFLSTVGGIRIQSDTGIDLAVLLAAASASANDPLGQGIIALGEVGLSGALRAPHGLDLRLREAARQGFRTAIVPRSADITAVPNLTLARAGSVREALAASGIGGRRG